MKIKTKPGQLMIIGSDIHIGKDSKGFTHDEKCVDLLSQVCANEQPDYINFLGDVGEFKNVMRHVKRPDKYCDAQDELDMIHDFLSNMVNICPKTKFIYQEGNHEDMLTRFLAENAAALMSIRGLNVPSLLGLDDLGITWVGHRDHLEMGELTLIHGQFLSGSKAGNAAHKGIIHYGTSYGQGHCHTLGKVYQTKRKGMHVAFETGHLRSQNPDYIQRVKPWQQGFASVRFYEHGFFHADVHPIFQKNGKYYTMFDKKLYEA